MGPLKINQILLMIFLQSKNFIKKILFVMKINLLYRNPLLTKASIDRKIKEISKKDKIEGQSRVWIILHVFF